MGDTDTTTSKNRLPDDPSGRWTEIELLPAWDEEYYDVYTAKKLGKWVMLKTLKAEYRNDPKYRNMIEKEFEVRYNLAHPNIVMINDFENVPGIGMCIITDDVYGDSLRKLLDEGRVNDTHIAKLKTQLPAALEYIQLNHIAHHPLRPERIIFTEKIGNLKLIDVGYDQKRALSHDDTSGDIENYGSIVLEVLDSTGHHDPELRRIAERCVAQHPKRRFRDIQELRMRLGGHSSNRVYILTIAFLVIMIGILTWILASNPNL